MTGAGSRYSGTKAAGLGGAAGLSGCGSVWTETEFNVARIAYLNSVQVPSARTFSMRATA